MAEPPRSQATGNDLIVLHVLEDGFTALGKTWERGDEIRIVPDSEDYKQTFDRNGDSWLDMTEDEQFRTRGKINWRYGPWPGDVSVVTEEDERAASLSNDPEAMKRIQKRKQRQASLRVPSSR
jgi:hypothetical protein